ncbi:MAG TPA: tetratricopeptide repeat protein, partial [Gemmataceae bacterium]|nr:tetratricopeptide repeat protein [Gemmataceae bacterium]
TSHDEDRKAVNHVEQMYLSRCFEGSLQMPRPLGCTSCHDPHVQVQPQERVDHYRRSCLNCHEQKGCTIPEDVRRKTSKDDSCIACHMPRFSASDIPHTASTNHQIIRDARWTGASAPGRNRRIVQDRMPIRVFHKQDRDSYTPEERRDEVIALAVLLPKVPQFAREFLAMTEQALAADPSDYQLWATKGSALATLHRHSEALAAFQSGLERAPNQEALLVGAAVAAQNCGRVEDALRYWRRVAELNPSSVECHTNITLLAGFQGDWPEVKEHAEICLKLSPANTEVRKVWVEYWLHQNDRERAKAEFAKIEALQPKDLAELQAWFQRQMK